MFLEQEQQAAVIVLGEGGERPPAAAVARAIAIVNIVNSYPSVSVLGNGPALVLVVKYTSGCLNPLFTRLLRLQQSFPSNPRLLLPSPFTLPAYAQVCV